MKYKMLVLDIDGTLLNSEGKITDLTKKMIKEISKDIKIVLASARGFYRIESILKELDLINEDQYTIAFNGSYICNNLNHVIFDNYLNSYDIEMMMNYLNDYRDKLEVYLYLIDGRIEISNIEDLNSYINNNRIYKIVVFGEILDVDMCKANMSEDIANLFAITKSEVTRFECVKKGLNKVSAIKSLADSLNIKREEIVCIGDGDNDKDMIEYAGVGVAMKNAIDSLKEAASYITDDNNNDGVGKFIRDFMYE